MSGDEKEIVELERIRVQMVPPKLFKKIARRLRRCDPKLKPVITADFIAGLIAEIADNPFEGLAILKQAEAFFYLGLQAVVNEEEEELSEKDM